MDEYIVKLIFPLSTCFVMEVRKDGSIKECASEDTAKRFDSELEAYKVATKCATYFKKATGFSVEPI